MNFKDIVSLHEAYIAVYDEELRDELESSSIQEDLSFIDDLSDNELTKIMEEIFSEGEFELNECVELLDFQILSEETEMERMNRLQNQATRAKKSAAATAKREKSAERERVGRKHAVKRLQVAATRAGRNLASRAKTLGAGAASAAMGGAAEAGRKLSSAKEKVKGFLSNVKKAAIAGYGAAKKEFGGEAGKEARARTTGRKMRRAARAQASAARGRDTSEFERKPTWRPGGQNVNRTFKPQQDSATAAKSDESKPTWRPGGHNFANRTFKPQQGPTPAPKGPRSPAPYRNVGVGKKSDSTSSSTGRALPGSPVRAALPPARLDKRGRPFNKGNYQTASSAQNRKLAKRLGEDFDLFAEMILEDLINEGYAETFEQAFEVLESFSDYEISQIVENYLVEEREDLYDVVLEHLLDEGFAETEDEAAVIMANMSEEWRDEILDEAVRGSGRSIADRITGDDIRSVRRGDRTVYTKPKWQDDVQTKVRRGMGRGGHENPYQHGSGLTKQAKRSAERMNAIPNIAVKHGYDNDNVETTSSDSKSGYKTVPTDYRARRRRASGR